MRVTRKKLMFEKRLVSSVAVLLALAWLLFLLDEWSTRTHRLELMGQRADSLATALDLRVSRSIRVIDQMLKLARTEIAEHRIERDAEAVTHILERHAPNLDDVYALAFLTPDGTALALSTPDVRPGRNHADRDFFRFHQQSRSDRLYAEKPFKLPGNGQPAFTLSRSLRSADGRLIGVILAAVKTEVLAREMGTLRIGSNGSVGLHHLDSYTIIARQPNYAATAAASIVHADLRTAIERAPTGRFEGAISTDNVHRFLSYRKLSDLPLAVSVGISYDDIDHELSRDLFGHLVTMAFLTLIVPLGAYFLLSGYRREKSLKQSLQEKNALLNAFFASMPAGIATLDRDMRYRLVNPGLARINGFDVADYTGKTVADLQPKLAERLRPYHFGVFAGTSYSDVEFHGQLPNADGGSEEGYWRGYFFPIRANGSDVVAMGCFVVDVTAQKKIAIALRHSEALLSEVLDVLPVGVALVDADGRVTRRNDAFRKTLGDVSVEDVDDFCSLRGYWANSGAPLQRDDWALAKAIARRAPAIGDLIELELQEGIRRTILVSAIPLLSDGGDLSGTILVVEDISSVRNAQAQARMSSDFFERLFSDSPLGIVITDREGRYLRANTAFERFSGYTATQLKAMSFRKLVHPEEASLNEHIKDELLAGRSIVTEKRYVRPDGSAAWGLLAASTIADEHGQPLHAIGQVIDITALKETERALIESQQNMRALATHQTQLLENDRKYVAQEVHDELGQLLTALKYGVSTLDQSRNDALRYGEQTLHIRELVEQTIAVVRRIASHLRPAILDLGLLPALDWLASDFTAHTKIPCKTSFPIEVPELDEVTTTNVFRAIQESLTNIGRHSGAETASISLRHDNGKLLIQVSDDGCGFDRSRIDSMHSFGLFSMRERILSSGGTLTVDSTPGAGTIIEISIPFGNQTQ